MRILHVGWGFAAWRPGGLILYAEDLMRTQAESGHDVSYFFSGRHFPLARRSRLRRWTQGAVAMYELSNSRIVPGSENGTRRPDLDVSEPESERAFRKVLSELDPDVVHIQELLGLPSSLIDIAADADVPMLMTLQDYFPLCTTLRLFDADGRICMRRDVGEDCVARNADAPLDARALIGETLFYELFVARSGGRLPAPLPTLIERAARRLYRPREPSADVDPGLGSAYQRRREVNVRRLRRIDRLIAQSPRVAEIYSRLGVDSRRISTTRFTLGDIGELRPRSLGGAPDPVTFGTLSGCASPSKGSRIVTSALRRLREQGAEGRFRLLVIGWVDSDVIDELRKFDGVEVRGRYRREELSMILDEVDVGLIPSIWEEALGYTGLEMVAKGIPLIANPLGGIVEYAREGQTAWLNHSCTGEGLASLMLDAIEEPERVLEMHRRVVAAREDVIPSWEQHAAAIERHYREIAAS